MCSQKNVAKNAKKSSASEDVNRRRTLDKSYPSPNKSRNRDWVCVLLLWSYIYVLYILHMVYSYLNYVHKYIHGLNWSFKKSFVHFVWANRESKYMLVFKILHSFEKKSAYDINYTIGLFHTRLIMCLQDICACWQGRCLNKYYF